MADVSIQNERVNGWIPSSATNVILNWPEMIKTQPHDDRDNCFLHFDSKGPCGMTVNNDIDDDSATKHGDSHMALTHKLYLPPPAERATSSSHLTFKTNFLSWQGFFHDVLLLHLKFCFSVAIMRNHDVLPTSARIRNFFFLANI